MKAAKNNRIEIKLPNGYKLVAEQNNDPQYNRELFVGIENADGVWHQDLAVIRNSYSYGEDGAVLWDDKKFDILVYGSEHDEDFTEEFSVGLYEDDE